MSVNSKEIKKYDIDFIKNELNYLKKHHNKKFTKTYEIYKYKFGNPENYGEYPSAFAEFLAKNENNAFFHFQTQESIFTSYSILNQKLFFPSKKKEVERLDSKTIQKWINRLGSSNCDFDGSCESKWISLDQYQEQIYYKEQDIDNLNDKYAEFDFNMPEKEMDETTKKALEEYFEASEKIIDYYDVNLENEEKILKNKWIKIQNGILDFEFGEYAKNDAECLEKILLSNEKIIKGHIDTVYSAFSRLEPLSNFNLVDNIIQKNWKDYPNFFEFNNGEYGFEKLATDVITGKLKTNETEILGFRSETDTLSQVQKETKKLKMKM